ncbi:MAG TPA: flagellar motor protein MotA [Acetobacteraceae bacterium]|nr:flagellar motor protein MotA [Acetobacteraceae bacterium]
MTRPTTYLWRMLLFLGAVGLVVWLLSDQLVQAFGANPVLNAVILAVLAAGIVWNLRQVIGLRAEAAWVEGFRQPKPGEAVPAAPRLLAPMASMLSVRRHDRFSLSALAMRSVLDGIASRLDESRELSRYMTGLLIFLGLLGTFWGLLETIGAVADVIGGMSVGSGDLNQLFNQLKEGLSRPLAGMGMAFSTSMLGLAGALVLGFMDLTAGQAQNRFFNDLEEWLAGLTRLSSGVLGQDAEAGGSVPVYVTALLEQTAENLEALQNTFARGEEARLATAQALTQLAERLSTLAEQMRVNQQLMLRVAEAQQELSPALRRLAEAQAGGALDEASRGHLRNLELYIARLLEETQQGRIQSTNELRNEIKVLTRTIVGLSEEGRP